MGTYPPSQLFEMQKRLVAEEKKSPGGTVMVTLDLTLAQLAALMNAAGFWAGQVWDHAAHPQRGIQECCGTDGMEYIVNQLFEKGKELLEE